MITETPKVASPEKEQYQWDARCSLLFKVWVQLRYNRRRQRFFDLADKLTKAATLLLGASLFGSYLAERTRWVATAISGIGLMALVFGYGDRKQLHKELSEKAAGLVKSIERMPAGAIDDEALSTWLAEYADLLGKSPPPLKTLTMICEHEQSSADGHAGLLKRPWWPLRLVAQIM